MPLRDLPGPATRQPISALLPQSSRLCFRSSVFRSSANWAAGYLAVLLFAASGRAADDVPAVDFAHKIVPLLQKHCVDCHGGLEAKGSFSINTRELVVGSGYVEPGDSEASYLLELILSEDADVQMPPADRPRMTADEVNLVRAWLDSGVAWEDGFSFAPHSYEPPLLPRRPDLPTASETGKQHPLDRLLAVYLQQNQLPFPEPIDDAAFLRRASLDLVGLPPTTQRLETFVNDSRSDKRERLIDELLADEIGYTEHWLTFFNDLLRNDYSGTGFITGGRSQVSQWLYEALRTNLPFDELARQLISPPTAASRGFIDGIKWRGEVSAGQTVEIQFAQSVAQSFLGINLKCASCHDSFIDRWTLDEAFGLAAIYSERPLEIHRCDTPIGRTAKAAWLFPEIGQIDSELPRDQRLAQLAQLMTDDDNGRFSRTIVNRLWYKLMGRGIIHPLDAMQSQPWDEDLLDFLAVELSDRDYDLKSLLRLIATSEIYQAASAIQTAEPSGEFIFQQPLPKRLTAEQYLDAAWQLCDAAPSTYDAPVTRGPIETADQISAAGAQWIWGQSANGKQPPAGETIVMSRTLVLPADVQSGGLVLTVDNSFELFINGQRVAGGQNWNQPQAVSLSGRLHAGENQLAVVATNAGEQPNPAGLYLIARFQLADGATHTLVSDDQWRASQPLTVAPVGSLPTLDESQQPVVIVPAVTVWTETLRPLLPQALAQVSYAQQRPIRASLMKNDFLMKSLGRPLREQIVSMRPDGLTTLEAIDLYNGQTLADVLDRGGQVWADRFGADPAELVRQVYLAAYSRQPSETELAAGLEFLGDQPESVAIADLLWAVIMNPEFIVTR